LVAPVGVIRNCFRVLAEKFDGSNDVADCLVVARREVNSVKSILQFDLKVRMTIAFG